MFKRLLQASFLLLISGCTVHRVSREIQQTMVEAAPEKLATLLRDIKQSSQRQSVSKTLWLVHSSYKDRDDYFRLSLVLAKSGDLRFDLLPKTGSTSLGLGVVTADRSIFLDPAERKAYLGGPHSPLLRRALGIELDPTEFAGLVLGQVDLPSENVQDYHLWCMTEAGSCVLEWADFQRLWWFEGLSLRPSKIEHRRAQTERLILNAEYHWGAQGPTRAQIETTDPAIRFNLENALNQSAQQVSQKLFEISPPQSYTISSLP